MQEGYFGGKNDARWPIPERHGGCDVPGDGCHLGRGGGEWVLILTEGGEAGLALKHRSGMPSFCLRFYDRIAVSRFFIGLFVIKVFLLFFGSGVF